MSQSLIISGHVFCGYPWHNPGVSLNLIISGHGFCGYPWLSSSDRGPFLFGCQGRTDTSTRIFGALYTICKPIKHNPGVSLPPIFSSHRFCSYLWLSRLEGGPFPLASREGLTLVLGFLEQYILYPRPISHNPGLSQSLIISGHGFCDCFHDSSR